MKTLPVILLALLAGCANTSTQMIAEDGHVETCKARGVGLIGVAYAVAKTQNCIAKLQAAGFHKTSKEQLAAAKPADAATATPITIISNDGAYRLALPSGWNSVALESPEQKLAANNPAVAASLVMSSISTEHIEDWQTYAETLNTEFIGNLTQGTTIAMKPLKVKGHEALQTEFGGLLESGQPVRYLGTVVKTDKAVLYVLTWGSEPTFASYRNELESLVNGLQL
jgi:hypothetical protein